MKEKILIVEDDPLLADMLRRYLEREGYRVLWDSEGIPALRTFEVHQPDLVILDLMLPDADGFDLCKRFSLMGSMILIISARDAEEDVIVGLEMGADDYVKKPFNMREVLARVRALLRRRDKVQNGPTLRVGDFEIREEKRKIYLKGEPLDLTPKEFLLLRRLILSRGKVVSRSELASEIYDRELPDYERIIDTYIYRIRARLLEVGKEYANRIKTVRGFGYSFE